MRTQEAHPHRLFVPEQVKAVPPSPDVRERLAKLRAEALARANALWRAEPGLFVKPRAS